MACIDVVMPSPPRSAATVSNDNNNNNNTVMICGKTILVSLVSGRYTYLIHTGNIHTAQGVTPRHACLRWSVVLYNV